MLKFMKGQQKLTPERIQKQKELFAFNQACFHGFPSKPSAVAWDGRLRLLAIATKTPAIRVYGRPGVEVYGQSESCSSPITKLLFLQGQCRLVSLCEDNSLHLWEMREVEEQLEGGGGGGGGKRLKLIHVKSTSLEGKLKRISVVECGGSESGSGGGGQLLVGTEGGNIYLLHLNTFTMADNIIYQDVVMQNVPEDYKVNPGPVEAIAVHPSKASHILIGYQKGLVVLWDMKNLCADQTYISSQQLESICWHPDANNFTTSHNDGSYVEWATGDSQPCQGPHTVYGPFPCKPITKILRPPTDDGGQYTVFSGGMPRASYGDKNTVTVIQGEENHVTFSLSSKVIDFDVILEEETGIGGSLIVLTEEEIILIDLLSKDWPPYHAPYLASLHTSAITCSYLASGVINEVFRKLQEAGKKQHAKMSSRPWPVNGGRLSKEEEEEEEGKEEGKKKKERDVLLTGHEDGTVQVWDASGVALRLLHKVSTAGLFVAEDLGGDCAGAEDDDWPPFRKAGLFDPYSDDPRLGVKKLQMCPYTGQLAVAGTAGQVVVMSLSEDAKEEVCKVTEINLVADNDTFVWKSHTKLELRTEAIKLEAGLQPTSILQFYPPASCTSLALHSEWGLLACGTAHGFALYDTVQNKSLLARSTLSPLDLASTADEGPMSRRKSLKKSLRESFRRLRKGRSQRKAGGGGKGPNNPSSATTPPPATSPQSPSSRGGGGVDEEGVRPVERAIEARSSSGDHVGSMVRCLHLTKCFIANNQAMSATLWAGTNSGTILVFTIAIPPSDKRGEVQLSVQLAKEIHLKHGAPVLSVWVLDGSGRPLPPPMAVKKEAVTSTGTSLPHRVLICSEEQFKVFTLPQLKPFCKFKLTAHEGSRARKLEMAEFISVADKSYSETCLCLATNQGDLSLFSLPDCRRQMGVPYIKREDISGINSVVFSRGGEALFLTSPSELERVSLSTQNITRPRGEVVEVKTMKPLTSPTTTTAAATTATATTAATQKKGGEGESDQPPPPITAAAATTAASTTTATTTTTTTATTNDAAESTTLQLKASEEVRNGDKEEPEGKNGGASGGEAASGGGGGARKVEETKENGDNSVLSGDITIDSIRDHIDDLKTVDNQCGTAADSTITTSTTATTTTTISGGSGGGGSVSVIKATTITASATTSQESQSTRVVETAISSSSSSSSSTTTTTTTTTAEANHSAVNGTE